MADKSTPISNKNILAGGTKPKELPPKSGLFHTVINCANIAGPAGEIQYQKAANEQAITNNGAWIVLGTDRPSSIRSGYGASGGCRAASIDLVVGRLATARKGAGPKEGAHVNPDYSADAARIFIGQMTNIDHNLGIAQGNSPQSKARSAIGIKADAVRVVGREGIKLVTGGMQDVKHQAGGEPTSLGKEVQQPSPTIEFIAGNGVEDEVIWGGMFNPRERIRGLQGICLGGNTRDALRELTEYIDSAMTMCDALAEMCSMIWLSEGIQFWMTPLVGTTTAATVATLLRVRATNNILRTQLSLYTFNYLAASSPKCIWSRNVKTT
jgi:hypothetical protein